MAPHCMKRVSCARLQTIRTAVEKRVINTAVHQGKRSSGKFINMSVDKFLILDSIVWHQNHENIKLQTLIFIIV